jgi:undecaprenyl diphosphate synthase
MSHHASSTLTVPDAGDVPRHVAIIMDGNGRWATTRRLPRVAGHSKGVEAVRATVEACVLRGVEYLTLFAFSSENWRRPPDEVSLLMRLFIVALEREVAQLRANGIRLKIVCANYGGRWDILQATRAMLEARPDLAADPSRIEETDLAPHLAMRHAPEPDLFIRTGGEQRISNFMLWQLAYSELHFTDAFWPDFGAAELDRAFEWYRARERRFGRTSAQVATPAELPGP